MAKVGSRQFKTFTCTECKAYSYRMDKNVKNTPERMEIKKHCPTCKKHTVFKEEK